MHRFIVLVIIFCITARLFSSDDQSKSYNHGIMRKYYQEVNEADAKAALHVWGSILAREKKIDFTIDVKSYDNLFDLLKALERGEIDSAHMTPLDYYNTVDREHLELGLTKVVDSTDGAHFILLCNSDKDINSIQDLKGKELVIRSGSRSEIAMEWLDNVLMKSMGETVNNYFTQINPQKKASQMVLKVFFGQADSCLISLETFRLLCELNPQLQKKLKEVARSEKLIYEVMLFRKAWGRKNIDLIKESAIHLHEHATGRQILTLFQTESLKFLSEDDLVNVEAMIRENRALRQKLNSKGQF